MLTSFLQGFGMGGGLIVAIGAQNAFILTQAVKKNHTIPIMLVCIVCDMIFIGLGVSGVGAAVAKNPTIGTIATWGGAAFLVWYGLGAFKSALKGGTLETGNDADLTLKAAVLAALAVTLLNPHFYLDTIVLLGSVSGSLAGDARLVFGAGAIAASIIWFASLSFGGRLLAPLFAKPAAWRVLDGVVCSIMWLLAFSLIRGAVSA